MGNDNTKYIQDLSEDSSESESEYSLEPRTSTQCKTLPNFSVNMVAVTQDVDVVITTANLDIISVKENGISCTDLTTDASANDRYEKPEKVVTIDKVLQMEKDLDDYEIVSLVFLLYEDAPYALQELMLLLRGAKKNLIYNWALAENSHEKHWQRKLVEALCVIKNYKVLKDLGYRKDDLVADFLPQIMTGITSLNKVRKAVYLICEKLNKEKTEALLKRIKQQFNERNMSFDTYDSEFLELYFLRWESIKYASPNDMTNVKQVLKQMNEEILYDMLDKVAPQVLPNTRTGLQMAFPQRNEKHRLEQQRRSTSTDTQQNLPRLDMSRLSPLVGQEDYQFSPLSPPQEGTKPRGSLMGQDNINTDDFDDNRYPVDPDNPGVLLIINQKDFYTEFKPEYKDLLPEDTTIKLEVREGTEKDQADLEAVFNSFGFKVISASNLNHIDMVEKIRETVKSVRQESSLFICIMSHGEKGIVYGSNSCKVKVSQIQEIMYKANKKHLANKPKFLILQSCQGKDCEKLEKEDEDEEEEEEERACAITTDGSRTSSAPSTADMFTFWATVPGYAAIRNKRTGSWFIQALCEKLKELSSSHHFADICTRVRKMVSSKTWVKEYDTNVMTPMMVSTLGQDFYFPPMRC